jgi:hypothetical protein
MTYWLVMFLASASAHMLHVGNFTSMQDCMDAAHTAQFAAPSRSGIKEEAVSPGGGLSALRKKTVPPAHLQLPAGTIKS